MPVGCGVWPAYWMFGPDWPTGGEFDIIEGVNFQTTNQVSLHTGAGCHVNNTGSMPGTNTVGTNCNSGGGSLGCGVTFNDTATYGVGFNEAGGGVWAMEVSIISIISHINRIPVWFRGRYIVTLVGQYSQMIQIKPSQFVCTLN